MKSRIYTSTNNSSQKKANNYYANYHFALQLYYIYKLESSAKGEPRLPLSDWRRPVIKRDRILSLKNVNRFLNANILPLKKIFGWFSAQLNFNYVNFFNK
jgi:hypothetical protein